MGMLQQRMSEGSRLPFLCHSRNDLRGHQASDRNLVQGSLHDPAKQKGRFVAADSANVFWRAVFDTDSLVYVPSLARWNGRSRFPPAYGYRRSRRDFHWWKGKEQ